MSLTLVSEARSIESAIPIRRAFEKDQQLRGRILIVDDSRLIRSVVSSQLSDTYECMQAESYPEAVEILNLYPFDLMIVDVVMPGLSEIEMLREVIEKYPDMAVIIFSSVDRPQRALDALRLGAFDYLVKPCELSVLELTVERAIDHRRILVNAKRNKRELEARNIELGKSKAELLRLQTQLVQFEKMIGRGQFAVGVGHEWNDPVAFVYGDLDQLYQTMLSLTQMLEFYESADLPDDVATRAAELRRSISHISSLKDIERLITEYREGTERVRAVAQDLRMFSWLDETEVKRPKRNAGFESIRGRQSYVITR